MKRWEGETRNKRLTRGNSENNFREPFLKSPHCLLLQKRFASGTSPAKSILINWRFALAKGITRLFRSMKRRNCLELELEGSITSSAKRMTSSRRIYLAASIVQESSTHTL